MSSVNLPASGGEIGSTSGDNGKQPKRHDYPCGPAELSFLLKDSKKSCHHYECPLCDKRTTSRESLKSHIQHLHYTVTPIVCGICQKKLTYKRYFVVHHNCTKKKNVL
jgi:hypothetical protein